MWAPSQESIQANSTTEPKTAGAAEGATAARDPRAKPGAAPGQGSEAAPSAGAPGPRRKSQSQSQSQRAVTTARRPSDASRTRGGQTGGGGRPAPPLRSTKSADAAAAPPGPLRKQASWMLRRTKTSSNLSTMVSHSFAKRVKKARGTFSFRKKEAAPATGASSSSVLGAAGASVLSMSSTSQSQTPVHSERSSSWTNSSGGPATPSTDTGAAQALMTSAALTSLQADFHEKVGDHA